jgi:hypothetical protein
MYPLRLRPGVAKYRGISALQNPSGLVLGLGGLLVLGGGAAWYFLSGPGLSDAGKHKKMTLDEQVANPLKVYADGRQELITQAEGVKLVATGQWRYGEALKRTVLEGAPTTSGTTGKGMRFGKGATKGANAADLLKSGLDIAKTIQSATKKS